MSESREARYWSCKEDNGILQCTTIQEAVQDFVDEWYEPDDGPLPTAVTVYGFAPRVLPNTDYLADVMLEHIMECLDEEYADPDGGATKPSKTAKEKAKELATIIREEYAPFWYEEVQRKDVRVDEYADMPEYEQRRKETLGY